MNWYFVPPVHTLTIGEGENILAVLVFLSVAVVDERLRRARRAPPGRRDSARALEAEALMRLAGSSSASALLESLQRVVGVEGAAVLHRTEGGWRIEAASGDRIPESPEASSATIPLDDEHVLVLAIARPQRGPARPRRVRTGAHRVGRARRAGGGGSVGRDARRRERASRRPALRRLARPTNADLRRQGVRRRASSRRTSSGRTTSGASSCTRSTRRPTGSTRSSGTSST